MPLGTRLFRPPFQDAAGDLRLELDFEAQRGGGDFKKLESITVMRPRPVDINGVGAFIHGINNAILEGQAQGIETFQITDQPFALMRHEGNLVQQHVFELELQLGVSLARSLTASRVRRIS